MFKRIKEKRNERKVEKLIKHNREVTEKLTNNNRKIEEQLKSVKELIKS